MKKGPKNPLTPEEYALWQKVTKTVRAYTEEEAPSRAAPARPSRRKAESPPGPPRALPPPAAPPAAQDAGTARALRKGKWPIDKKIDLHGMTQSAAKLALENFVLAAQRQDKRTLLVITGKGSRAAGGGVLRRMLPLWLELPPLSAAVLAATPARPEHGGEGAFYLRLRKKRR